MDMFAFVQKKDRRYKATMVRALTDSISMMIALSYQFGNIYTTSRCHRIVYLGINAM